MSAHIRPVTIPKWGLSMTEGTIRTWLKGEGDVIATGEDLVEIETTKLTNVYESPHPGVIRRLIGHPGQTLPVGALIAVVADASVPEAEIEAYAAAFKTEIAEEGAAEEAGPSSVMVDGHKIAYLAVGGGEQVPVVMIHGFAGDHQSWALNQLALAEGRRAIALDLPAHGGSDRFVPEGGVEGLARILLGFLDALAIGKAHLVGHSLGGAVALATALAAPERVASLSLVASAGLGSEINGGFVQAFLAAGRRKEMKTVLADLYADPAQVTTDLVESLLAHKRLEGVEDAMARLAEGFAEGDKQKLVLAGRLPELTMKLQAIWGEEDRIIPSGHAAALPEAGRHLLAGAGHMVHFEKADEVNRLLRAMIGA